MYNPLVLLLIMLVFLVVKVCTYKILLIIHSAFQIVYNMNIITKMVINVLVFAVVLIILLIWIIIHVFLVALLEVPSQHRTRVTRLAHIC